ncbi:hypothetical protein, partial [Endozoicomonas sp. ONNA1]|uniref:hypothetical protein n=1 Tax=Endozoicomonas sp. ONNA1 TaxID=2828740 RepID=UPI0021481D26
IFVNDEALLAAATSAYTQVHVLGKELQLCALEDFLSYDQPVGYVIHVEDETQIYPVPADYPKLEVTEAQGKIIVFRGQKQNPTDIAFVEGLHDIWAGLSDCDDEPILQVKKDNVRSYQYIIRSRQMALLEELALQHNAGLNKGRQYDQKLESLAYYEHLQQALTTATSDGADEFEFTIPHITFVSSFITPTWVHMQLVKHFGFKPVLRNFLTNRDFVHDIHERIPIITKMSGDPFDDLFDEDGSFASRVNDNFAGQLLEMENELYELSKRLQRRAQIAIGSDEEKLRTPQLRPEVDDEIMQLRQDLEQKTNLIHRLQKEIDRTNPQLERKVLDARAKARKIRNLELAIQLGMDDWDDTLPPEQQAELIRIKIHEIKQAIAAAGQFDDEAAKEAAIKAIYTSFAVYLNIQNFDDNTSIDVQKKCLIQKIKAINSQEQLLSQKLKTMDLQQDILIKRIKTLSKQQAIENSYTEERKYAIAAILGIQSEDNTPEDRETLESTVRMKLFEFAKLKQELQDIRTPGHPSAMPEVLKKLSVVEEILSPDRSSEKDDVYLRRQAISDDIQAYIREAGQRSEEKALKILEAIEALFNIKTNENDDKTTRVDRIRTRLNDDNLPKYILNEMAKALWEDDSTALEERDIRPDRIRKRLTFKIENSDQRARERQADYILALEDRLNIYPHENVPAKTRGEAFTTKLASDLGLKFTKNENLSDRKHALRGKILALMREVNEIYDDESIKRIRNYEIACQLGIKGFKDNAPFDQSLIEAKLQQLDDKVLNAGRPDVNDRIAAIENELDRQMARLGPKPRYVLERDVARARRDIEKTESELEEFRRKLDAVHSKAVPNSVPEQKETLVSDDARIVALRNKQLELFGDDDTADRILQLTRQHECLEREVEVREANIKNMKQALAAAEQAMENEGGPFQYTPKQANILAHLHTFTQAHPLRKQALEAALGLAESAKLCGKPVPNFQTFDFDDEFAPIRLQAKVPDLTFNQATRIVKVFKDLKTTFALESPEDQSLKILDEVQNLASHARAYIKTGPQEYDDEIYGMGEAATYFVQHEQGNLKDFSEYFAVRSVSGNKIISLLREGLISQVELDQYLKAVRGVDGYQTVDEFEHFLDYGHGVKVPRFKAVVRMLSDEGVDEFVQSAFSPVIVTATEPAGMKESVAGMKEYVAAVIANYVLDDIAFENGRKTAAFLTNIQDTLAPYANAVGVSESGLIKAIHDTLMQAHATAVELELNDYWIKPSAFLLQAVTWYLSSYKPLLVTRTAPEAVRLSLSNMAFLYLLDLTNR